MTQTKVIGMRTGIVEHGTPRHFYFDADYFNDNGKFWSDLENELKYQYR